MSGTDVAEALTPGRSADMSDRVAVTVGRAILDYLRAEDVRHVFGVAGSSFLELLDAFHDSPDMTFVGVRHEQAAAHMAEGYARATMGRNARFGVCLATSGPGVTNLVTGVAMARQTFTPMLVVGGSIAGDEEYKGSKQELDQLGLFRPVTKEVMRITRPERAGEIIRHAIRIAMSGQPGPVYLDIPKDVFPELVVPDLRSPKSYRPLSGAGPVPEAVAGVMSILRTARRPLILAGAEFKWLGGTPDLVALAESLQIPVVSSAGHRDVMPNDHPLFFGQLGQRGSTLARDLGRAADVVVSMGTRLAYNTTVFDDTYLNPAARLVQCGIEPRDIGRHFPVALGFVADAGSAARAIAEAAGPDTFAGAFAPWLQWCRERRDQHAGERHAALDQPSRPVRSDRLYAELRRAVPDDVQVVVDSGYLSGRAHDAFDHTVTPSLHTPLDFRCVGHGLPMALGVKFARPDAPVLAIQGDGGFAMNMAELETAVRFGLGPVVLILNNFAWGAEKRHQARGFGGRFVGSEFDNPRFDRIAAEFGCRGVRIEDAGQLGDVLKDSWHASVPTVIDVMMDRDEI